MTARDWLALLSIVLMLFLAVWGVLRQQTREDSKAQWEKINELEREQQHLRTDVNVLCEALRHLPTTNEFRDRLQDLQQRLESKIHSLGEQIQALALDMAKRGDA